jgi:fatty-acyl-CoA synthase
MRQSDSTTLILIDSFKDSDYVKHLRALCPELDTCQPGKLSSKALPCLKNVIYLGTR